MKFPCKTAARLSIVAGLLLSGCGVKEGQNVRVTENVSGVRPGYSGNCQILEGTIAPVDRLTSVCPTGVDKDGCFNAVEIRGCVIPENKVEPYEPIDPVSRR